jgi:hypothetical protein
LSAQAYLTIVNVSLAGDGLFPPLPVALIETV